MNYLVDTNVFFEILRRIGGESLNPCEFDLDTIRTGNCFISKLTELEILSVIGKYARGGQENWDTCNRMVCSGGDAGETVTCRRLFRSVEPMVKWRRKRIADFRKLLKEVLEGNSKEWAVTVLPLNDDVMKKATEFMEGAILHRFGSLDALIAGTAQANKDLQLIIVTHDRRFRVALGEFTEKGDDESSSFRAMLPSPISSNEC